VEAHFSESVYSVRKQQVGNWEHATQAKGDEDLRPRMPASWPSILRAQDNVCCSKTNCGEKEQVTKLVVRFAKESVIQTRIGGTENMHDNPGII
jgi:hypothetical protein